MLLLILTLVVILIKMMKRKLEMEPYRLGDFVRHVGGFQNALYRNDYAAVQDKTSLIRKYHDATERSADIEVLSKLIQNDPSDKCIIHLRLGDVIDNSPLSVNEFWKNEFNTKSGMNKLNGVTWSGSACNSKDDCSSSGYINPESFYVDICNKIPSQIVIISGSHKKTLYPEKSQEYIKKVMSLFNSRGKTCELHWNRHPDLDFSTMCNAKTYVSSGGGFSQLAALVVKYRGGTVIVRP